MAKSYHEKDVNDWNVNDFMKYFGDRHYELFEVEYLPNGSWSTERGIVANAVGTTKKKGKYDKEVFKRFLDVCLNTYKPTKQYPGTSIGFSLGYRKNILQQVMAESKEESKIEREQSAEVSSDISDWFLS